MHSISDPPADNHLYFHNQCKYRIYQFYALSVHKKPDNVENNNYPED